MKDLLFNKRDTVCVYGDQRDAIQSMIDYDYICKKEGTSIVCIVNPTLPEASFDVYFYGNKEILIPTYPTIKEALNSYIFTIFINFASSRSAFLTSKEAIESDKIEKIVIIAEGVPERESRILRSLGKKYEKVVIGPATTGGLISNVVKIGNAGGTITNLVESRLDVRGNVGLVSKSGGLMNELMTIVARNTNGVCEAIAIGGDRFPATNLVEQVLRFEANKDIKLILILGEIGGVQEYEIVDLIKSKKITKPIVAWVSGIGASSLAETIQFGHAGAMANSDKETSDKKVEALKSVGVKVPSSYPELEIILKKEADAIGIGYKKITKEVPSLPHSFDQLMRNGELRYHKQISTSISKKRGVDESYVGQDIAQVSEEKSVGYIMGLMWFKKEFSQDICVLFELMIKLAADHGPSVSGAQNTIITARAGKDLVSSLVSGLLTIGPRFGGAVNDSAKYMKSAVEHEMDAFTFVEDMKKKGINIPGIGHKVKSRSNPDRRVLLLLKKANEAGVGGRYITYMKEVEIITTRKKDSLILNVDGAIAATLLDILSIEFSAKQIDDLLRCEAFNAFFVLGRSIGLIGHYIDQKRLHQGLYRHPEWDILEVD